MGFTPDPAGGAHDAPQTSSRLGGGYALPTLHPVDACGVSFSAPSALRPSAPQQLPLWIHHCQHHDHAMLFHDYINILLKVSDPDVML